jgi:hypothetical protein
MNFSNFKVPYQGDARYNKKVAYFSMEFAVHQPLKISDYSFDEIFEKTEESIKKHIN